MDYLKIQMDVLKAAIARDTKHRPFQFSYSTTDEKVWLMDNLHIEIIPNNLCFIALEKIFDKPPVGLTIFNDADCKTARNTMTTKFLDATQCAVFQVDGDDVELWCDIKLLKNFDIQRCTFRAVNHKSPLYIYENEELVGLSLPVRHS